MFCGSLSVFSIDPNFCVSAMIVGFFFLQLLVEVLDVS